MDLMVGRTQQACGSLLCSACLCGIRAPRAAMLAWAYCTWYMVYVLWDSSGQLAYSFSTFYTNPGAAVRPDNEEKILDMFLDCLTRNDTLDAFFNLLFFTSERS
jgi:hypothetical protein